MTSPWRIPAECTPPHGPCVKPVVTPVSCAALLGNVVLQRQLAVPATAPLRNPNGGSQPADTLKDTLKNTLKTRFKTRSSLAPRLH